MVFCILLGAEDFTPEQDVEEVRQIEKQIKRRFAIGTQVKLNILLEAKDVTGVYCFVQWNVTCYDLATNMYKSTLILAINNKCTCDQDLSVCKSICVLLAQNWPDLQIIEQLTLICWSLN